MLGGSPTTFRREDYEGIEEEDLRQRYEEGRRRLAEVGAVVPGLGDELLSPANLWLQVAFLESVIQYETERERK